MQRKNGLDIRNQQEKIYQNNELLFRDLKKFKKCRPVLLGWENTGPKIKFNNSKYPKQIKKNKVD